MWCVLAALGVEDEQPEYDMDEEDSEWLAKFNKDKVMARTKLCISKFIAHHFLMFFCFYQTGKDVLWQIWAYHWQTGKELRKSGMFTNNYVIRFSTTYCCYYGQLLIILS